MRLTDERQMNERCKERIQGKQYGSTGRTKGVLLNEQTIPNVTWDAFEYNGGWTCHRRTVMYLNSEGLLSSDTDRVIRKVPH